jgi:hypothetical protein
MAVKGQTEQAQSEFVTSYGWLLAPGDHIQADYTSPTRVKNWLQANPLTFATEDQQKAYGQWLAQLLQNQLAIPLVSLYQKENQTEWPFTLREDVIAAFTEYFNKYTEQSNTSQ